MPDASKKDIGRAYKAVVTLLQKENKVPPCVILILNNMPLLDSPCIGCCCPAQLPAASTHSMPVGQPVAAVSCSLSCKALTSLLRSLTAPLPASRSINFFGCALQLDAVQASAVSDYMRRFCSRLGMPHEDIKACVDIADKACPRDGSRQAPEHPLSVHRHRLHGAHDLLGFGDVVSVHPGRCCACQQA